MEQKGLSGLNKACREVGVCDSGAAVIAPGVKRAAELYKEGSEKVVRIVCWDDGCVSSCVAEVGENGKTKEKVCCYTAEDGGMELAMAWEKHLTSPEVGYKARAIEVEGQKSEEERPVEVELKEGISACGDVLCP